jgi:glutathione synthase/RimK-type ligase-like ATP-grasp enzyme
MIAIHDRPGSYSDRWIRYCKDNGITYKLVNCLRSNIMQEISDCDVLLWHWSHTDAAAKLFAYKIIRAIETTGKLVYPSSETCWHYDDKVAQKYLLEAIGAPLVPTYVFYNLGDALEWIEDATFPKVFKLKSGAGSQNVRLVRTKEEAVRLAIKSFRRGFNTFAGYFSDTSTKLKKTKKKKNYFEKLLRMPYTISNLRTLKHLHGKQIGYVYFQDFLPNNMYDTRITVIRDKAFGFIRYNRNNDFRASGSGNIETRKEYIDEKAVTIAHEIAHNINMDSVALDFLYDKQNNLLVNEISYSFISKILYRCPGYWDDNMVWHNGNYWPEIIIIENML